MPSTMLNILNSNLQCDHILKTCQIKYNFSTFISLEKYVIYTNYKMLFEEIHQMLFHFQIFVL